MKDFQAKTERENLTASLLFILPAFVGTVIFIIIPVFCSFSLSFFDWDLLNEMKFVGLDNYKSIFTDKLFWQMLKTTFVYAFSTTFFGVIIPLVLACILNNKIRGSEFYKAAYFIPFITPMIVIAMVWQWIFDPNIGLVNQILHCHLNWLYDKDLALPILIFISVWKLIGYNMIIFLSGFATINQELLEASKIDGADGIKTFRYITIPLLAPTILFVIITSSISAFQVFDLIYITTQGGPENSTMVVVYSIYKYAFEHFDIGRANAIAYVLFAIIFVLAFAQWKLAKKVEMQ